LWQQTLRVECESCSMEGSVDELLICGSCGRAYHNYCLVPPLPDVPRRSWQCALCIAKVWIFTVLFHTLPYLSETYEWMNEWMNKWMNVQNSLTRVVLPFLCHLSASERLSYLHWLPVHYQIQFKIAMVHSPIRSSQPVNHLISTISSNYTSHHELSVLQPSNYSKYHICLQILVSAPSATALLQHGIAFLPPSKIVRPYIVSSAT